MTTIPDYFLDELIYKNYENRPRTTFRPQPCRITALYAELLHATLAQHRLGTVNTACSLDPFSMIGDQDDILIAVAILVSQGKLVVDKPVEAYRCRKTLSSVTGGYFYPLDPIEVVWVEAVTSDAFWRAYRKGLAVTKSWTACHEIKEAEEQMGLWEGKLAEAKNALAAWRRRRHAAEKVLASPPHPHLVDACNPNPESDS